MLDVILQNALIIGATIDPLGTLAIFVGLTGNLTPAKRRRVAIRAVCYATAVLLGAIILGQFILDAMGIRMVSFQLSGGVILFLFGLQMIFGSNSGSGLNKEPDHDIAVFPLAIPATATPGAILGVILLTDNNLYSIQEQAITAGVTIGVLAFTLMLMLMSTFIIRLIGLGGISLLTRLMGIILAAFSVELVMNALGVHGWLTLPT